MSQTDTIQHEETPEVVSKNTLLKLIDIHKITQHELAENSPVSQSTISRIITSDNIDDNELLHQAIDKALSARIQKITQNQFS